MSKTMEAMTLADANSATKKIDSDCARLIGIRAEAAQKLGALELSAGARYLEGDRSTIKEISELRAELDLIERALGTLGARRAGAELDLKRATAADLRQQAEAKRSELLALEKKTKKLLESLSALEGVAYTPGILSTQHSGAWYRLGLQLPTATDGAFVDLSPDPTNRKPFAVPKSRTLRSEISDLEHQAAAIEDELGGPVATVEQTPAEVPSGQETLVDTYVHPGRFCGEGEALPGGDAR